MSDSVYKVTGLGHEGCKRASQMLRVARGELRVAGGRWQVAGVIAHFRGSIREDSRCLAPTCFIASVGFIVSLARNWGDGDGRFILE